MFEFFKKLKAAKSDERIVNEEVTETNLLCDKLDDEEIDIICNYYKEIICQFPSFYFPNGMKMKDKFSTISYFSNMIKECPLLKENKILDLLLFIVLEYGEQEQQPKPIDFEKKIIKIDFSKFDDNDIKKIRSYFVSDCIKAFEEITNFFLNMSADERVYGVSYLSKVINDCPFLPDKLKIDLLMVTISSFELNRKGDTGDTRED